MSLGRRLGLGVVAGALLLTAAPRPTDPHEGSPPYATRPARRALATSTRLAIIRPAPDFTLRDFQGRSVRLSELGGRVTLLSFIYTSCPAACPLVTQRMALLASRLRTAGLSPSRVILLSITVDPERDTETALERYAKAFGADRDGWRFLRESPERLRPVLEAYDEWAKRLSGGEIDHPARLYLIDSEARIREIYSLAFFHERDAFVDIQALLRESR